MTVHLDTVYIISADTFINLHLATATHQDAKEQAIYTFYTAFY